MSVRPCSWLFCVSTTLALCLCACSSLTDPGPGAGSGSPAPAEQPVKAARTPPPQPTPAAPAQDAAQTVKATHILIAFKDALRAAPTITRSKDEAKALATRVSAEARAGHDFDALALKYSDDPSAKTNHGNLGQFTRGQMVKPFSDAAFALKPGDIQMVPVETAFGFHIIKRTE